MTDLINGFLEFIMTLTAQDVISILSIFSVIVIGIRSFLWAKEYREAKQAILDAKEAGFQAKTDEYESQLASKDERIRLLELIADPEYGDKVQKTMDEQKSNIGRLQATIQQLKDQLSEANDQIEALKEEIRKLSISETERSSISVFTAGSSTAMGSLLKTADEIVTVSGEIEKSTFDPNMFPSKINIGDILKTESGHVGFVVIDEDESENDDPISGNQEE